VAELYSFLKAWRILGTAEGDSVNFETWGCLRPKLLFIFTGYTNSVFSVGRPKLLKMPPMLRITARCMSVAHCGLAGSPDPAVAVVEARLALKNTGPAWSALARAVQFVFSYFPRTSGKQTMHHFKDASTKQLGCIKLFLP